MNWGMDHRLYWLQVTSSVVSPQIDPWPVPCWRNPLEHKISAPKSVAFLQLFLFGSRVTTFLKTVDKGSFRNTK